MNIIIIEDELKAAKSLENIVLELRPAINVVARLQSVKTSVQYLKEQAPPDLIFMDIQLADGLCFEIFKAAQVTSPVVFCTAFDEYALEAFKANGIDYILKPFEKADIANALKKVDDLKNFFQQRIVPDLGTLLSHMSANAGKKNFLVFHHNKYINISTDSIAYFYIRNELTWIMCFDQQQYIINQSLDQVSVAVSAGQYYRVNRQYLVSFRAIKEVEPYFMRKLLLTLTIPTADKLLINKEKQHAFLQWMENR